VAPWLLLAGGGALLSPLGGRLGIQDSEASLPVALAGQGVAPAVLGGFRAMAADVLWLRTNLAWERRDAAATEALLRATVAADGRAVYFRLNGARMLAYDFPAWRTPPDAPAAVRARHAAGHAERALAFLDEGMASHGPDADSFIEMARICQQQPGDLPRAAGYYRQAAELPGAPYFAGRLHVELLVRTGGVREARDWLRGWLPRLPADDPAAERARMAARLAELEQMVPAP